MLDPGDCELIMMNPAIRDIPCHSNNTNVNKKAPVGPHRLLTVTLLAAILALGTFALTGCSSKYQKVFSSGQTSEQPGGTESKIKTSTGETSLQNSFGSSNSSTDSSNPDDPDNPDNPDGTDISGNSSSSTSPTAGQGNTNSSSANSPVVENKPEDKGQNSLVPVPREPFVGKKYPDAVRSLNTASEIVLEIVAYYDGLYGVGKCKVEVVYDEGVSWEYTVTTPDGIVKYQLPLKTCVLSKVS